MRITPQQQRIPLVDLQTGLIRREWLGALTAEETGGTTDLTAIEAALAALIARVANLEALTAQQGARLDELEGAPPTVRQPEPPAAADQLVVQPGPATQATTMVVQPCCP